MHDSLTRPLRADDLPSLMRVADEAELFPGAMLPDMAAPSLDGRTPDLWLVAERAGEPIGFAFCEPERMTAGTWNMLAIAVLPDRQGAGVGSALVAAAEGRLAAAGGRVLLVETAGTPGFARTRGFYRARGYAEEARIRDFYQDGEDKVVFWKRLVPVA